MCLHAHPSSEGAARASCAAVLDGLLVKVCRLETRMTPISTPQPG